MGRGTEGRRELVIKSTAHAYPLCQIGARAGECVPVQKAGSRSDAMLDTKLDTKLYVTLATTLATKLDTTLNATLYSLLDMSTIVKLNYL